MNMCCFYDSALVNAMDQVIECWNGIKPDQYKQGKWDPAVIQKVESVLRNFRSQLQEKQLLSKNLRQQSLPFVLQAQDHFKKGEISKSTEAFENFREVIASPSS